MTIGKKIQKARFFSGFTQMQLAQLYAEKNGGRGKHYIRDVEQDRITPGLDALKILTEILGYELRIFGEEVEFVERKV